MILNSYEEKILRRIHDLGPGHVYNKLFQDKKSQAAVAALIRLKMIDTHFDISDEQVERYRRGQASAQDEYDLHLNLTEGGLAYYDLINNQDKPCLRRRKGMGSVLNAT